MALPKIDVPIFSVDLLSVGKKVRFRPFTVKEEKLFLMASESDDVESIIETTKQVISNCLLDDIDINKLPIFDIEHLFLNLRARSIGEVVDIKYRCNNEIEKDGEKSNCNNVVDLSVNVLEIHPESVAGHSSKIEITDKMGVVMKYPSFESLKQYSEQDEVSSTINLISDCIDYIYDDEQIYYAKDSTKEELVDFIETLQTKDLEKFKSFFDGMPKMKKDVHFKCNKCGYEENILVEGIQNFFV